MLGQAQVLQITDGYMVAGMGGCMTGQPHGIYLSKLDINGDTLSYDVIYPHDCICRSLIKSNDDGYIIAGSYNYQSIFIIKTDANGDTLWTKIIETGQIANSIQQTWDGGYIIAGYTTKNFQTDLYIVKLASDLNIKENHDDIAKCTIIPNTILSGKIPLPIDKIHRIFDIAGRQIHTLNPAPGIYFIEVDGEIEQKVIKVK
jgi:hypothetical protein